MLKIFISLSLLITLTACSSTIRSYKQEGHTDLATVKFSNFYDTKTHELYICQEGNAGFIRLPKDRTVNVKANEPTRILIKINKKKESCLKHFYLEEVEVNVKHSLLIRSYLF